ncbi:MAG TPA: chromosome segregation protein SMC [Nitrospirae bacterium]|nr:chromosome segregation protein SMC [Nitrospirota bacterium]
MKIERLELNGFKSFADKTTFTFHPGITCIAGPNGCGKSNIVDAVRWVLGEQSAKTLRGDKMDEVIFNGSQSRKPKGMAEVTLYISYPDGQQDNGQGGERVVTVTRRLYRSGESEYMINRNICRLRDIREMFLDTGLEIKRYSIIEQGSIGELINARPQERRFLIEEVAGIMKYKARKTEAISKLESSRLNLQRISDILSEVKRQRNSLQRQAKKAERYKALLDELKQIEIRLSKADFNTLMASLEAMQRRINELKDVEAEKRKAQTELEKELEISRIETIEKERELSLQTRQLEGIEHEISDAERRAAITRRDIEYTKNAIQSMKVQVEEFELLIHEKEQELVSLGGKDVEIKKEIAMLRDDLRAGEDEIKQYRSSLNELEETLKARRREVFALSEKIGEMRNLLHRHEATVEGTNKRIELCRREIEEAHRRVSELKEQAEEKRRFLTERERAIGELKNRRSGLTDELSEKKNRLNSLVRDKSRLREEILSMQSRATVLRDMVASRKEQEVLKSSGINIISTLSEVLEVDPAYDTAVEAALSDRLKGIMLSSTDDLRRAVDIVNRENLPRHVFIYSNSRADTVKTHNEHGDLRPLYSLVSTDENLEPLLRNLLDNYFIVEDIESALRILEGNRDTRHMRLVTYRGEVVESEGVVIAGKGTGILGIRRELRGIEKEVEEKNRKVESIESEIESLSEEIEGIKDTLKRIDEEIISSDRELSLERANERRLREDIERFERKAQNLESELEQLDLESEELQHRITQLEQDIAEKGSEKLSLEQDLDLLQAEIARARDELNEKIQSISDVKIRLKGLTERLEAYNRDATRLKDELSRLKDRRESNLSEISRREALIEEKKRDAEEFEEKLKTLVEKADIIRRNISVLRDDLEKVKHNMTDKEEKLRRLRRELEETREELHREELLWTEHSMKLSALKDNIRERYGIEIEEEDVEPSSDYEEDREALTQLRARIDAMGQVNLGALDEFNELNERFEFLQKQHDDIVESIAELEEAIRRINRTTRKMLTEAFEALNTKFNEVFQRLFNGGSAELRLTDENNILESGIDVIVRPPGKRLQNISLLSGGEKALAALSLMFAGFLLKPTPLCLLDEADAPLDESNTVRFRDMIKELSGDIQFIVITHNKVTMEISDYLYGITMDEPGVSKVLSMEFVEG